MSDEAVVSSRPKLVKSVGPRLRVMLWILFAFVALIVPNSLFMSGITFLNWRTGVSHEDSFYLWNYFVHIVLGILIVVPFLAFVAFHVKNTWHRKNYRAIRAGYGVFIAGLVVLVSGFAIPVMRDGANRNVVYWLHVILPLGALWMYWLHRLSGPKIKWRMGGAYAAVVAAGLLAMIAWKVQDPRGWNRPGPQSAEAYFFPSLARTSDAKFIDPAVHMSNEYCLKCHQDAYNGWYHSAHRFSSFNNPAYLSSVRETRKFSMERDGNMKAARWCAGCHDPVPFFGGMFDDPNYDDVNHPTAKAGITCTTCHAITNVNSARGNADFTIEEPIHYPFAMSDNPLLQWINNQLVKAKPSFHKATFLKPLHKTSEFCSTCHKVHLPEELNKYKWLRGQNHYDSFLLSGVSGHGARSFYYPEHSKENCNSCHMPTLESEDRGAKVLDASGKLKIHDHFFPSANTAIAHWRGDDESVKRHQEFLQNIVRIDIFGLRDGGTIDGALHAPLRPSTPTLKPGGKYLLEAVVRTTGLGHHFTQGTVDSNEVWVELTVKAGDRVIGRNGALDAKGEVDPWSHFINVYMLDRDGKRIDRRNPQNIFTPLYNNQIPPGAGAIVHYELEIPADAKGPITVEAKLNYRKFDAKYMEFIRKALPDGQWPIDGGPRIKENFNDLPITVMSKDSVTLAVAGSDSKIVHPEMKIPVWQRWNDYGIGLLLEGNMFSSKGELKQAAHAFAEVEKLKRYEGPLNLARVYFNEGRLDDAVAAIERAAKYKEPSAPLWTMNWLTGLINAQQGRLDVAAQNFRECLNDRSPEAVKRGFDFSKDYEVRALLGQALYDLADRKKGQERIARLQEAAAEFEKVLLLDSEHIGSHYRLAAIYGLLNEKEKAEKHRKLHLKYKDDDNARDRAVQIARKENPAAARVADRVVIYPLHRAGAPGLAQDSGGGSPTAARSAP
jgi:tetratricopeptide (TPR) repeat protein